MPMSEAFSISLYFNKTLLHRSSERSSLVSGPGLNSSPPGAKNPGVVIQQQPFTPLVAQMVNCLSTMQETWVRSLGGEDSLEKEMATHSSTLALKIPWTEELGAGYYLRVANSRAQLSDFTYTFHFHALEKETATHSSTLALKISWTEELGAGYCPWGLRVGHD